MKKVSIIIPVFNEEKYIIGCINSVLSFTVPDNVALEILIADGRSTDKTVSLIQENYQAYKNISIIDNPEKYQANGINRALKVSNGDFIMRLDAHAIYPVDYLVRCFENAENTGAENTGGIVITLKGGDNFEAGLVQAMTTHKFGVGDSAFRTEETQGFVDTVPFGFFKREVFEKIGFLDERLVRCQDYEFNRRIGASGGKLWLDSRIQIQYFNQPTLKKFYSKQFYKEAPYNPYMWYLAPYSFAIRHAVTGVFSSGIILGTILSFFVAPVKYLFLGVLALYFLLAVLSALQQSIRYKQPLYIIFLPLSFFLYHFIHGLGIIKGVLRLITGTSPVQKINEPWPGAGKFRAYP